MGAGEGAPVPVMPWQGVPVSAVGEAGSVAKAELAALGMR